MAGRGGNCIAGGFGAAGIWSGANENGDGCGGAGGGGDGGAMAGSCGKLAFTWLRERNTVNSLGPLGMSRRGGGSLAPGTRNTSVASLFPARFMNAFSAAREGTFTGLDGGKESPENDPG